MKVILKEKVKSLGNVGEIVNVSSGYARNYLIPRSLGVIADESNQKELTHSRKTLATKMLREEQRAKDIAKKIEHTELDIFKKVGSNGKLFGAITTADISRELSTKGVDIERRLISLDRPIKSTGRFSAKVKIFSGIEAVLSIVVNQENTTAKKKKTKAPKEKEKEEKDE